MGVWVRWRRVDYRGCGWGHKQGNGVVIMENLCGLASGKVKPMTIKFKRLHPDAVTPKQGSEWAAGFDITAISRKWLPDEACYEYGTGLAIEVPKGFAALLFPRSSIFRVPLQLSNSVGVIDADYRGEIKAKFRRTDGGEPLYQPGNRIGQLVIIPIPSVQYIEAKELSPSKRGTNGYGSTGR